MDFISQLIEENTNRAIAINQVLVKNETQLTSIQKDQEEINMKNKYVSTILDSWNRFLNRIWKYSSNKIQTMRYSKVSGENTLVDLDEPENDFPNQYPTVKQKQPYLDQLAPLRNITQSISHNLDKQNDMLVNIKNKNKVLENQILGNQEKINTILKKN